MENVLLDFSPFPRDFTFICIHLRYIFHLKVFIRGYRKLGVKLFHSFVQMMMTCAHTKFAVRLHNSMGKVVKQ